MIRLSAKSLNSLNASSLSRPRPSAAPRICSQRCRSFSTSCWVRSRQLEEIEALAAEQVTRSERLDHFGVHLLEAHLLRGQELMLGHPARHDPLDHFLSTPSNCRHSITDAVASLRICSVVIVWNSKAVAIMLTSRLRGGFGQVGPLPSTPLN